ncbi:MAG: GyrI-like domain-containing protein [Candidatus Thorarchaeota archaeon]
MEEALHYKEIKDTLVLKHTIHGKAEDLPPLFNRLLEAAGDAADGDPVVVQHWPLTDEAGRTMDVCLPISRHVDSGEFEVTTLEGGTAAVTVHRGPYDKITETYQKIFPAIYQHGHPVAENGRETYPCLDLENPENTVVEIQAMLVGWETKFEHNLERVLGADVKDQVMTNLEGVEYETEQKKRASMIKDALHTLDEVSTEEQKFEVLSRCGHVFPVELIEKMRNLYRETKSIDTVIQAMNEGHFFYPKFRREGRIVYDRKSPARKEAYEKAQTREEKLRAICFCPLLKDVWDEMPETFCYCSAGWARQVMEGIIEEPVKVDVVRALTKGDEYCEFAVHLPDSVQ